MKMDVYIRAGCQMKVIGQLKLLQSNITCIWKIKLFLWFCLQLTLWFNAMCDWPMTAYSQWWLSRAQFIWWSCQFSVIPQEKKKYWYRYIFLNNTNPGYHTDKQMERALIFLWGWLSLCRSKNCMLNLVNFPHSLIFCLDASAQQTFQ